jgi:hypothetical protein
MQADIPENEHFARYVSRGKIVFRDDGVEVLTPDAFRLRPVDEGLSGAWFEHAGSDEAERVAGLVDEWHAQVPPMKIRPSGRITLAQIAVIKIVGRKHNRSLRVRHEPAKEALCYAQVRGVLQDDLLLLEELARDAVVRLVECV